MATQAQQTELLTLLVGMFDAAPTAELFNGLVAGLDAGATVDQYAEAISTSSYFTGLYADTEAFAANFGTALVGEYVSEEVLAVANQVVAARLEAGDTVADVIAFALTALSSDAAANSETWGAAAAALSNKVEVAQYFVDNVSGSGLTTVAEMQAILAGVTEDAATVTAAQETIDTDYAPAVPGETFTLTTGTDTFKGTDGNDTFTGTTATLAASDVLEDSSSTDNDTLNLTITANTPAATIAGIENINVVQDVFAGVTFDATNVSGAKAITLSGTKLGFDGAATVTAAGSNGVVAGSGVTNLVVNGVSNGTVDAGAASNLTLTAVANTRDVDVTVNGDINLFSGSFKDLTLTATTASNVDLVSSLGTTAAMQNSITIGEGSANVTLKNAETQTTKKIINSSDATVVANVDAATAVDASAWDVDNINLNVDLGATLTTASGANVATTVAQTGLAIAGVATTASTNSVNLTTSKDLGGLTVTNTKTTNIAVSDKVSLGDVNVGTSNNVVITGSGNASVGALTAGTVDASAFTGELSYTAGAETVTLLGGSGVNKVTTAAASVTEFTGQGAADVIDARLTTTGTLGASLGGGNDTVRIDTLSTGATVVIDGGAGTDTVSFVSGGSTAAATNFTLTNVEVLSLENTTVNGDDTLTLTLDSSNVSGKAYTVSTAESNDTATVTITVDGSTADLSTLTLSNIDAFVVNGTSSKETIVGTSGKDTITGNGGADTLTGGAGDDTFEFVANDSTVASLTKITDFQAAAASGDNDTLNLAGTAVVASNVTATDVEGINGTNDSAIEAIFAGATGTVNVVVSNGIMSLSGLSADTALADTLSEWVTIATDVLTDQATAEVSLGFVFGGNTYIVEQGASGTVENVIELTGLTTATALSDVSAAANTIFIA